LSVREQLFEALTYSGYGSVNGYSAVFLYWSASVEPDAVTGLSYSGDLAYVFTSANGSPKVLFATTYGFSPYHIIFSRPPDQNIRPKSLMVRYCGFAPLS